MHSGSSSLPRNDEDAGVGFRELALQLRTSLRSTVVSLLDDPRVSDVLLNPDGSVWIDSLREGRQPTGLLISSDDSGRIVHGIAGLCGVRLHSGAPIFSHELGEWGARFIGVIPPLVRAPSFAVHKFSARIPRLRAYVADGLVSQHQVEVLRIALDNRRNILISGSTQSGKTTLANALLSDMAEQPDRVLVLERGPQLRCAVPHHLPLRTLAAQTTMSTLLQIGLRWCPDRVVVSDLDARALPSILQVWQRRCPGGFLTISAGSDRHALESLEEILKQMQVPNAREMISQTVHGVSSFSVQ